MKSTVSAIFLALALISSHAPPIFAESASSAVRPQTSNVSVLPEFVPSTGRTTYTLAVEENKGTAARRAAEALSDKFADITTGSISKSDDPEAKTLPAAPAQQAAQPTHASQQAPHTTNPRSIVLAANERPNGSGRKTSPPDRAKGNEAVHRIPRAALAKEAHSHSPTDTRQILAVVGQKVGFLDRLTNPALWPK
jgi:hypothetical protein